MLCRHSQGVCQRRLASCSIPDFGLALVDADASVHPQLLLENQVDLSHSLRRADDVEIVQKREQPFVCSQMGLNSNQCAVPETEEKRHQGVSLFSPFALVHRPLPQIPRWAVIEETDEWDQFLAIGEISQPTEHGPPGDRVVRSHSIHKQKRGPLIQTGQSLHDVGHTFRANPLG